MLERVLACCARRPMLASLLREATVLEESEDRVRVAFAPAQRAAAAAHLHELKPYFAEATGRRGLELELDDSGQPATSGPTDERPAAPRTRADADLDHPLVRSVAELFDATPKRVEPRRR